VVDLHETLRDVQRRLSVVCGRQLTQKDLALLAHASPRALGEWMRGAVAPAGMSAVLNLLSQLPPDQVTAVLANWRSMQNNEDSVAPGVVLRSDSH
jgi:hypothetical protein